MASLALHLLLQVPTSPARLLSLLHLLLLTISAVSEGAVLLGTENVQLTDEESGNPDVQNLPRPEIMNHESGNIHFKDQTDLAADNYDDCYPLNFSKNMSIALSEASGMLDRVKGPREKEWLKTFIKRLASLTDNLLNRTTIKHPRCSQVKNQDTLVTSPRDLSRDIKNMILKDQTLFPRKSRSHVKLWPQNESSTITKTETNHQDFVTGETLKIDDGRKLDNNDNLAGQIRIGPSGIQQQELPRGMIDIKIWKPPKTLHEHNSNPGFRKSAVTTPHSIPAQGNPLHKLLSKMSSQVQQLKDLGGTKDDIMNLWKENESKTELPAFQVTPSPEPKLKDGHDFGYEEPGAATGELQTDDNQQDLIVAPSLNKAETTMSSTAVESSSTRLDTSNELHSASNSALQDGANDEDDLVRQLQAEKFLSEAAAKTSFVPVDGKTSRKVGSPIPKRSPAFPVDEPLFG